MPFGKSIQDSINLKIHHKLFTGLVIIASIFSGLFYFSLNMHQRLSEEFILEGSTALAGQILNKIDKNLNGTVEELQALSGATYIGAAIAASNEEFSRMNSLDEHIRSVDMEWIEKKDTPFITGVLNSPLSKHLSRYLADKRRRHGSGLFSEIFLTNRYGVVVASTGRTSDYYQADEKWYQLAVKDKGFWIGDVEFDESSQSYSCPIVINIYNKDGDFAGIMKASMNMTDIIGIINQALEHKKHESDDFKLITGEGRVIYSTEKGYQQMGLYERWSLINEKKGDKGYVKAKSTGIDREKVLSFVRSRDYISFNDIEWTMVVEHDLEELLAPATGLKKVLWVSTAIIALFALLTGYLIARSISSSFSELIKATQEVGHGRLDTRVMIRSRDEIGELSGHFNRMVEDLQKITVSNDHLNKEIQERVRLERELKDLATTDRLTGAYNRLKFDEVIGIEIARARRNNEPLSLIIIDVDDFKRLNDTHGHLVGDRILIALSSLIRESKREYDYFFRWGGEEFLLIAPETDIDEARILADRVRREVAERIFDNSLRVTISLGVAELHRDEYIDDCIKRADDALYMVKNTGKNGVEYMAIK